jgi:hypothetical protein
MSADRNLIQEVRNQVNKATRMSGCLREIIWRNAYVNRIQNNASNTDLCSRDFEAETTVKVRRNESFRKYKMSHFKRPNKER